MLFGAELDVSLIESPKASPKKKGGRKVQSAKKKPAAKGKKTVTFAEPSISASTSTKKIEDAEEVVEPVKKNKGRTKKAATQKRATSARTRKND